MAEVLVVDDDPEVREILRMYLAKEGFDVRDAESGPAALAEVRNRAPALVILDVMMPEMDGFEVCRRLQAVGEIPTIFLTCRDDDLDAIIGLEVGADDYITKPFNPREVVARVKAVLRRSQPRGAPAGRALRLGDGDLEIDPDTREAHVRGVNVRLTPKEFDILFLLASHTRVVFPREQIMHQVWGYDLDYDDVRTVDTHVKRLRKKIVEAGSQRCTIEAVWGTGYRLVVEPAGGG